MDKMISLDGLDKAEVLAALYNAASPQGMGFLQYDPKPMTVEEAGKILGKIKHFDYLKGRALKIDLSRDVLDPYSYDKNNGCEAARLVVDSIREKQGTNSPLIQASHIAGRKKSAVEALEAPDDETDFEDLGENVVLKLGMPAFAKKKIRKIIKNC